MATIVQSYTNEGSATQPTTAGVPAAQVVAITDGEGSLSPTLRASAGGAAIGQTLQQFTGNPTLSTTVTTTVSLFTVPAGKTFYITDVYIGSNVGFVFLAQIQAAGTPIFFSYCKGDTGPVEMPGIETQPQAASGTAVQLVMSAVTGATSPVGAYYIAGFLQ